MRTVELARVAASAEALRLRRLVARQGMRAAYGAGAVIFGLAVLVVVHVLIHNLLVGPLTPVQATLVLLAIDLVAAGLLAWLALRDTPSAVEIEAHAIRTQALFEMKRSVTVMSMAAEVAGTVFRNRARGGARRGAAYAMAEMASRLIGR